MQGDPSTANLLTVRELVPFSFQAIQLDESCWVNGEPASTRRSIGTMLGYKNPRQAINDIIKRNPYIKEWATVCKLLTVEGSREVTREIEVYGPIGLQQIIFASNQPKAIAFKIAAARLVWAYMNGQLHPSVDPSYLGQLRALDLLPRGQRGLAVRVLAQAKDCTVSTIRNHRAIMREGRDPSRKLHWTSMDHWDHRFPQEKALVVAGLSEGWPKVKIWREALGSPKRPTYYMVRELAKRLARSQTPIPTAIRGAQ